MRCISYVNCTNGVRLEFMRETDLPECGVARFLLLFDGPWATLIVRELMHGPQRFGQLREALPGISAHTLTNRLRMFEARGLVTRTSYAEIPPRVVYELTELGWSLRSVLDAMYEWGMTAPASTFIAAPVLEGGGRSVKKGT
ncbi:winged helix-turn-helix transcriptional regulator [Pseudarthrobacter sp. P1]|uniref:winged helix-turn-helix transcriptional regulator n=1 Tax=Pseudarthrobacter sp. P1 TaxID=3418418 RepID=UPI003CF2175E